MIVFTNVTIPRIMSIPAPTMDIHFLNKGALLRSQPVTPPNSSIGDRAVPKPNKTAKTKLSIGAAKGTEYKRSNATKYGHTTSPLLKPSEKACTSNLLPLFLTPSFCYTLDCNRERRFCSSKIYLR